MIDLHSHILPGIDDGPATLKESLEMARMAVEDGIHTMVATPHCLNGVYVNWRTDILSACEVLNSELEANAIPLKILPGSEAHLSPEIFDEIEGGRLMTVNDTGRYIFLEISDQFIRGSVINIITRLERMNVTPIITHPERNMAIQRDLTLLHDLVSAGALCQITARSLTGGFGPPACRCCKNMLELDLAHFIASDAHSSGPRPPALSRAFEMACSLTGENQARRMVFESPRIIIAGGEFHEFPLY